MANFEHPKDKIRAIFDGNHVKFLGNGRFTVRVDSGVVLSDIEKTKAFGFNLSFIHVDENKDFRLEFIEEKHE